MGEGITLFETQSGLLQILPENSKLSPENYTTECTYGVIYRVLTDKLGNVVHRMYVE